MLRREALRDEGGDPIPVDSRVSTSGRSCTSGSGYCDANGLPVELGHVTMRTACPPRRWGWTIQVPAGAPTRAFTSAGWPRNRHGLAKVLGGRGLDGMNAEEARGTTAVASAPDSPDAQEADAREADAREAGKPSAVDAQPVFVTGAAGLGANLVRRLLRDGQRVRVLLRRAENSEATDGLAVERVFGDVRDLDATREPSPAAAASTTARLRSPPSTATPRTGVRPAGRKRPAAGGCRRRPDREAGRRVAAPARRLGTAGVRDRVRPGAGERGPQRVRPVPEGLRGADRASLSRRSARPVLRARGDRLAPA